MSRAKKKKKKRLGAIPSLLPIPVMTIFAWWFLEKEFDKNYLFLQQAVSLDTESSQQQNVLKLPLRLSQKHLLQADRDSYPVISWKNTEIQGNTKKILVPLPHKDLKLYNGRFRKVTIL